MQEGGAHENSPAEAAATTTTAAAAAEATARSSSSSSQEEPQPQQPPQPPPASAKPPPEQAAKMVKCVGSLEEFQTELASAGGKLIVIDFSATWCGPCKMIKPFFHELANVYTTVVFLEIDVDEAQDVASHCDVKCMPTFQFYKNSVKVHEFSGANKEKLEETIKNLK